jgi:hypothetical protein
MQELSMGTGRTSIRRVSRVILTASISLAGFASARAFEVTAEQRAACTPDALRLCSSEIPDIGRIMACMEAKEASLSPQCRAVFQTASLGASHRRVAQRTSSTYASYHATPSFALHGRHLREASWAAPHRRLSHAFDSTYASNQEPFSSQTGRWTPSRERRQAFDMARKILVGFTMACQNHSIPEDLCNFSGSSSLFYTQSGYQAENNQGFFGLSP